MGFYAGKNILVAGAGGISGHAAVRRLLEEGANIRATIHSQDAYDIEDKNLEVKKYDFLNYSDCVEACTDMDIVINCVAYIRGAKGQTASPMPLVRGNLFPFMNLAEAACQIGIDRFSFVGSSTAYPDVQYPVKEDECFNGEPHKVYRGVGWMKRYTEQVCMYYQTISKTKFGMVRTAALYGPNDAFNPEKNHVFPDLIMRAFRREDPFIVWGDGTQVRDAVYIDDLMDGLLTTLEKHPMADPINIATGVKMTVKDIVEVVTRLSGYSPEIVYDTTKPVMIPYRMLDVQKAKDIIGWTYKTDFETGMKKTIDWYVENRLNKESK
jgi:GDP-L-fucose synthase